ncbi:MAG: hypothetical protein Q8N47_16470 [Bryobacterales bacterium]|nr:hypothetical protein [Bryobacterales bacterium]
MKLECNPRNILRVVPARMLQEYFDQRQLLTDFDWDSFSVDSLYDAWMALPAAERQAISVDFQHVFGLTSKRGIQTIIDAGRCHGVDLVSTIGKGRASVERVFRVLLDHPQVFRVASQFAWVDNLKRHWYRRHDLPKVALDLSEGARQELI